MKICLVSNLYPPFVVGGAEIYVERLARGLATKHRVVVVTTEPGLHLEPRRELTPEGITVYRIAPVQVGHLTRPWHRWLASVAFRAIDVYHPQIASNVRAIMAEERPDLVHVHNSLGLSLAAVLTNLKRGSHRTPVALTLHDYGLCCAYGTIRHPDGHLCRPDLACRLMTNFNRRLTGSVDLAISPSRYVMDEHLRRGFFPRASGQLLPYGLAPAPASRRAASQKAKSTFDVLFLGRVQGHKGIDVLIRAFLRLQDPALRLHVAGTGPLLESCKALAAGDPRIRFYGFVSGEMPRTLLAKADCMVAPSVWLENYPVSIQEALDAGPVVVASRVGGVPEMIRDGVNGLLVEPGNESALASAIERLRQSPELVSRLRAAASASAALYDMDDHVRRLEDVYRPLVKPSRLDDRESQAA